MPAPESSLAESQFALDALLQVKPVSGVLCDVQCDVVTRPSMTLVEEWLLAHLADEWKQTRTSPRQ